MTTLIQHFDGRTDGTTLTTANSATYDNGFTLLSTAGAPVTYSTTNPANGNACFKLAAPTSGAASALSYVGWDGFNATSFGIRAYLLVTQLPTGGTHNAVQVRSASGSLNGLNVGTDGRIGFQTPTGTVYWATGTISLNTWYRVEMTWVIGASGSMSLKVFLGNSTTASMTVNPTGINTGTAPIASVRYGMLNASAVVGTVYMDDFVAQDSTAAIGPYVEALPTVTANASVSGTTISLDATVSTYDHAAPTYVWSKTAGPSATLSSTTSATPTVTGAPSGNYTFHLVITDDIGQTVADDVSCTVAAAVGAPTVVAAMYHDVFVIDATASTAAAAGALSFAISPSAGLTTLAPGMWTGLSPSVATAYTVTVTEAGNATPSSTQVTVPAAAASGSGGTGVRILLASADSSAGGHFA